ncbi:MAG: hypothetical protein ACYDEV_01580 [Acidiferrobacter sp.]
MEIMETTPSLVLLRFQQNELQDMSDTIIKNAEHFASSTLNMAYILKEQAYRIKNDFVQPPHAFGD